MTSRVGIPGISSVDVATQIAAAAEAAAIAAAATDATTKANAAQAAAIADAAAKYAPLAQTSARLGWTTGLADALAEGVESVALHIIGDSTGYTSGKTRWPDLLGTWLAAQYPAYGVQQILWSDVNQNFAAAPTVVQAVPNGARYATVSGASMTHPGDGTSLTGQIELEIDLSFNNPSANVLTSLVTRSGGTAGTKQFNWVIKPSAMEFYVSADGSAYLTKYNTTTAPFYPAAGTRVRYRLQFNPNNGAGGSTVAFFYSTNNGTSWTQIGSTWTNAFTVTLNQASLVGYEVCGRQGASETLDGSFYGAWVRNTYKVNNGLSVVPSAPDLWAGTSTPVTFSGSPMLTILNGSIPGKGISYFNATTTRVALMTPVEFGSRALVLNNGHNDIVDANSNSTTMLGLGYLALWDAWLTNIRARMPDMPIAVTIQNHRQAPANYVDAHRARGRALRAWALKNGCGIIDVRRAWQDAINAGTYTLTQLVDQTDTQYIHPSDAFGSPLWASVVESHIIARV